MSNCCLSVAECKDLARNGKYVNFSAKVLEIAARDLTGTALKFWQFLSAESVFDADWSVKLSNKYLATYLQRSVRTVSRLIDELIAKHYLQCERRTGQITTFFVRLPASTADELRAIKRRRQAKTLDINVQGKGIQSYYLNNINNNSTAEQVDRPHTTASPDVVDSAEEIERLEKEKEVLEKQFTDAGVATVKNRSEAISTYEIQRQIGSKITQIELKINRLKPKPPSKPSVFKSAGTQIICDFEKIRLKNALNRFTDGEKLFREVAFSVQRGDLGHGNPLRGVNAALKLIQQQRWQTPVGMQ